jgi:hypothetical protein
MATTNKFAQKCAFQAIATKRLPHNTKYNLDKFIMNSFRQNSGNVIFKLRLYSEEVYLKIKANVSLLIVNNNKIKKYIQVYQFFFTFFFIGSKLFYFYFLELDFAGFFLLGSSFLEYPSIKKRVLLY